VTVTRTLVPVAGADGVLEETAGLVRPGGRLADATAALARLAPGLDLAEAKSASRAEGRGVVIAHVAGGAALAVKWFAPGEATTIHDHEAWGVAVICEGSSRYERWTPVDGGVRLVEMITRVAGGCTTWGGPPDDVHRQIAGPEGAMELILLGALPTAEAHEFAVAPGVLEQSVSALSTYDLPGLAGHYRDDVLFDANVPLWRYQLQGPTAILEMVREALGGVEDLTVNELRATYADDLATVEVAARFGAGDEAHLWREVHLVRREVEQIVGHTMYCTGIWDAAAITKQAAEAPMIRP